MVDNFKQIKKLLNFKSKNDFYFVQIIQRKKDHKDGIRVEGANNNSRLIKYYCVHSLEYFNRIEEEIKQLCELFNARAGINLNKRNYEKIALQHLRKVTDQIINKDFIHSYKAYPSVLGTYSNETDKKWIIDIDNDEVSPLMLAFINNHCEPISSSLRESKIYDIIPSKNGFHIITKPFNIKTFKERYTDIEIHKNNPTNLYIP